MFKLSQFFPREFEKALHWLGQSEWLRIECDDEVGTKAHIMQSIPILNSHIEKYGKATIDKAHRLLSTYATLSSSSCFFVYSLSKAHVYGPKLFRPTYDMCLGFEKTKCNITFEEYQQPFPVIFFEIPPDYQQRLKDQYGAKNVPSYVISLKHSSQCICATAFFHMDNQIVNIMGPRKKYRHIEDGFTKNRGNSSDLDFLRHKMGDEFVNRWKETQEDTYQSITNYQLSDSDFIVAEICQRLAINFSTMMVMYGIKKPRPLEPNKVERSRRQVKNKKGNPKKKAKAKDYLSKAVYLVEFEQDVEFYEIKESDEQLEQLQIEEGIDREKRKSPRTHWRMGYWKIQRCGPRLSETKRIFIRPVLVMAKNFLGELGDTSATYTGKKRA